MRKNSNRETPAKRPHASCDRNVRSSKRRQLRPQRLQFRNARPLEVDFETIHGSKLYLWGARRRKHRPGHFCVRHGQRNRPVFSARPPRPARIVLAPRMHGPKTHKRLSARGGLCGPCTHRAIVGTQRPTSCRPACVLRSDSLGVAGTHRAEHFGGIVPPTRRSLPLWTRLASLCHLDEASCNCVANSLGYHMELRRNKGAILPLTQRTQRP